MIPRYFIRSSIFNLCYYLLIAISCVFLLPTLFLPRKFFLGVVYYFVNTTAFLEKRILGLNYEIRGQENLPKDGKYIIASKHQSAYETTKLHILFKDPAIVLKKELLNIPLWGWYLAKSDQIAINRSTPKKAIESIKSEAQRVAKQNRPIIIFPQGTRVHPDTKSQKRPYKVGVVRVQEATERPIIPLALNTGTFYPRNAWIKKPGTVIFEFLKPIEYKPNTEPDTILKKLEQAVETKSETLKQEALNEIPNSNRPPYFLIAFIVVASLVWTINWFIAANLTKSAVLQTINDLTNSPYLESSEFGKMHISGFPFKMKLTLSSAAIRTHYGVLDIKLIEAKSWPIINFPINIFVHKINLQQPNWNAPIEFRKLSAKVKSKPNKLEIIRSEIHQDKSTAKVSGHITNTKTSEYPEINLEIKISEHNSFLQNLENKKAINSKVRFLTSIALNTLKKGDVVSTTLTNQKNKLYLGLIKVYELPEARYTGITRRDRNTPSIRRRPAYILENRNKSVLDNVINQPQTSDRNRE